MDSKTVKRPRPQPAHPQYANYWAPLTRKRHTMPHSAQPQHTNYWALRTRKQYQQKHRPQRPTESSNPTQHAKGRTGDCPGPCKGTTTRRNVTQGIRCRGCHNQHSPGTPTTGLRKRRNNTSRSTGRSGRQKAATRRNTRKGRTGDCPRPRKETATRRRGGGLSEFLGGWVSNRSPPPPVGWAIVGDFGSGSKALVKAFCLWQGILPLVVGWMSGWVGVQYPPPPWGWDILWVGGFAKNLGGWVPIHPNQIPPVYPLPTATRSPAPQCPPGHKE